MKQILAHASEKIGKYARALAYVLYSNFGLRLGKANSPEFTFALTCKQQFFAAKNPIYASIIDFYRQKFVYLIIL